MQHDAVLDAAVVGVPSEQWGETPVAFVVLRDERADVAELEQFVSGKVGRLQRPSAYYVIDALPRSTIGKVLKNDLRAEAMTRGKAAA